MRNDVTIIERMSIMTLAILSNFGHFFMVLLLTSQSNPVIFCSLQNIKSIFQVFLKKENVFYKFGD